MKINEKIFLSFFNKLIDKNSGKNKRSKNNNVIINNITNYIKIFEKNNKINPKDIEGTLNNPVEGDLLVKNNKNSVIKNRNYLYKLTKNENILLQYSLDRLLKGILSGSRETFGKCLQEILINFKDHINFDNLILLFLDLYNVNNVSNQEIRHLYLGRLEILLHLSKINLFSHYAKIREICKIVEYIHEVYNYKVYLQDSSNVLLIAIVNQLQDSIKNEVVNKILELFNNNDSLLLYFKAESDSECRIQKPSELQFSNNVVENKIMSILKDMKNVYPIVNIYVIDVIAKLNDPEIFKKLLNVLDCMLESSLNSVKTALTVYLILLFKARSELFLILIDNLSIYFKVIIKYYKYNNQLYIKQFINNYLHLLSTSITSYSCGNKLVSTIYNNLIMSKNDRNTGVNSDIIPYVNIYYNLLQNLYCDENTFMTKDMTSKAELQEDIDKEEIKESGAESFDNWNNENIYKVLNSINLYDKNSNVFLAVIKSLMNKLLLNLPNPRSIFNELMSKIHSDSFKISLIKLLILNNNFSLTTELLLHYTGVKDGKSESAESSVFNTGLLDLYVTVLTKNVNIIVNKRLSNKELSNHCSILCNNVEILNKVKGDDELLEKFYNLIKEFKTNISPNLDTEVILENTLIVTLLVYYIINTNLQPSDDVLQIFMNHMYNYVTRKEHDKHEPDDNLLYNMIVYNIFNYDDENLMNKLYNTVNKLTFKCVNKKFNSQIWDTIFKITLNNDLHIINEMLTINNILKQEDEESEDDEFTESASEEDDEDSEVKEDEDTNSLEEDNDEEDTDKEFEGDVDDLVVENFNELINETSVSKEKEKKKNYSLKITGYNLLLYLDSLDLNRLYLVLKDYNTSLKHNYSNAIYKFLSKMADNPMPPNVVSIKDNGSELVSDNVCVTVKVCDEEEKFELSEKVVRVLNYVLNNKNMKNVIVLTFKIMSKNGVHVEKVLNYITCVMYTKRTVTNHDILITLYKTFRVPCKINLFKLLTNNMKSVIKSKLLTLYTFLLNNDQVWSIEEVLQVVHKLLLELNRAGSEETGSELKFMDTVPNVSKQYLKSLVLCINNLVRHMNKSSKLKENKQVQGKLNEINQVIKTLNNKVINKYYVKYII
ncbi:uncharacterized protein TA03525 [Theileria annulata]|uniref:Uncharacterized protein n=1 Tax=Theileria annulata TaxID=5874 RepID=Q4UCJ1_THEAN|nr:uncharacterized protein TA03525 [Theileria annulata]CAI75460.1 hypothetical protein, conserved [Theileria annulata]|eukprot:XP_954936.1 hypothetical protein, conserved [Theileria annulata]